MVLREIIVSATSDFLTVLRNLFNPEDSILIFGEEDFGLEVSFFGRFFPPIGALILSSHSCFFCFFF